MKNNMSGKATLNGHRQGYVAGKVPLGGGGVRRLAASDVRGSEGGVSEEAWEEG